MRDHDDTTTDDAYVAMVDAMVTYIRAYGNAHNVTHDETRAGVMDAHADAVARVWFPNMDAR